MGTPHPGRPESRKLEHALDSLDSALLPRNVPITLELTPRKFHKTVYSSLLRTQSSSDHPHPSVSLTPTLSSIISRTTSYKPSTPTPAPHLEPSASDYSPSSLPSFLSRLSSYKLSTYVTQPSCIDAVSAAQAGWINEGKNRLVCYVCHASFVMAGRTGLTRDAANKLLEKQKQGLIDNHKDGCPWRTRQCDRSIYRIPLKTPTVMVADMQKRAGQIQQMLGASNIQVKDPLTEGQRDALFSVAFPEASVSQESRACIIVSFFGWTVATQGSGGTVPSASRANSLSRSASPHPSHLASPTRSRRNYGSAAFGSAAASGASASTPAVCDSTVRVGESVSCRLPRFGSASNIANSASQSKCLTEVVTCDLCQRRVGIWAFMSPKLSVLPDADESSLADGSGLRSFDVLAEHRSHCPFAAPTSTSSSSQTGNAGETSAANEAGWKTLLDVVLRNKMGSRAKNLIPGHEPADSDAALRCMVDGVKSNGGNELLSYMRSLLR